MMFCGTCKRFWRSTVVDLHSATVRNFAAQLYKAVETRVVDKLKANGRTTQSAVFDGLRAMSNIGYTATLGPIKFKAKGRFDDFSFDAGEWSLVCVRNYENILRLDVPDEWIAQLTGNETAFDRDFTFMMMAGAGNVQ